jgi:hypothetical protein
MNNNGIANLSKLDGGGGGFRFDLNHLTKMSRKLKQKPFSGKHFITYLRSNAPFCDENYEFSKDSAIRYAQNLLEAGYLMPTPPKSKTFFLTFRFCLYKIQVKCVFKTKTKKRT